MTNEEKIDRLIEAVEWLTSELSRVETHLGKHLGEHNGTADDFEADKNSNFKHLGEILGFEYE
jgi:hypothetical protein